MADNTQDTTAGGAGDTMNPVLKLETTESIIARGKARVQADLDNRFTFHPVKPGQPDLYEMIRDIAKSYAEFIVENTPAGREQALALTKIEEAVFWANAAVARRS